MPKTKELPRAELVVLGAGPGGYTAAFRAADLGLDTVLVERYPDLGGVCLNVGCIPSKELLHVADVMTQAAALSEKGVTFESPVVDPEALRAATKKTVGTLTRGLSQLAKRRKVRVVQGSATFADAHRLSVDGPEGAAELPFDRAIIAAGSRPTRLPNVPPDDPRIMDSTAALELQEIPASLLVVGGGIIGLEMATLYQGLGTEVTVVELTERLMPTADPDLVKPLRKRLEKRGARILLETGVAEVEAEEEGLVVSFEGENAPEPGRYARVLVSIGRKPNGDRLEAARAGVEVTERGFIPVDGQQRTNVEHIFAVGDIVGEPMLAHKASHEGKVAAEAAAGRRAHNDARVIPSVAYTDPEVAWVGLTESQARAEDRKLEVGRFPWAASGRAVGLGRTEGQTKLLFDPESGRLLGGGLVGPHAGELIAELALALELGVDGEDLALTIHPHPTLSETVSLAAEAHGGTITELYLSKRKKRR